MQKTEGKLKIPRENSKFGGKTQNTKGKVKIPREKQKPEGKQFSLLKYQPDELPLRGFQTWWPYVSRPQGRHYIGLDGLKLNFVHNFSTKQHFSMKFWILATLMLKGSHVIILVKFDL